MESYDRKSLVHCLAGRLRKLVTMSIPFDWKKLLIVLRANT